MIWRPCAVPALPQAAVRALLVDRADDGVPVRMIVLPLNLLLNPVPEFVIQHREHSLCTIDPCSAELLKIFGSNCVSVMV